MHSEIRKIIREVISLTICETAKFEDIKLAPNRDSLYDVIQETVFKDIDISFRKNRIPAKAFCDKNGNELLISVNDYFPDKHYTIAVHTKGRWWESQLGDGFERKELIGVLWLKKGEDGIYRSEGTMSDSFWVKDEYRRKGIGTAMHEYAKDILNLKTDISGVVSDNAKSFWKNRNLNEDVITHPTLKSILDSDEAYAILDKYAGGTWTAGGCAILAFALNKYYDFPVWTIFNSKKGFVDHFVVRTGMDKYLDYDGVHANPEKMIQDFRENEMIPDVPLSLDPYSKDVPVVDIVMSNNASMELYKIFKKEGL